MIVKPFTPQKPKPYALLTPSRHYLEALTSTGDAWVAEGPSRCAELIERLWQGGFVCYTAGRLADLRLTTGSRSWEADVWRGQPTRMRLDGVRMNISSVRSVLEDSQDVMAELNGAMRWLADQGIAPASLSSMSWSLWRTTLTEKFQANFDSTIGRAAFYGGRQGATPGDWHGYRQVDISQAYPFSMNAAPYARSLMAVSPRTTLDPSMPGIARAAVFVPPTLATPPLPRRLNRAMIRWEWGPLEGCWTWRELVMAHEAGCDVEVQACWAPTDLIQPFGDWNRLQAEGRQLENGSGLVKILAALLWGLFGMTADDAATCRWEDDAGESPVIVGQAPRKIAHEGLAFIAAETASRVRSRMYTEALMDKAAPVHIDTDGVVIPKTAPLPVDMGDGPGQWRVKSQFSEIQIRGPQVYRSLCGPHCGRDHPMWHYTTAGIPPERAFRLFEGVGNSLNVAVKDQDYVLPDGYQTPADDAHQQYVWADGVRRAVYGQPLVEMENEL